MPTLSDPVPVRHEAVVTGIYIARGDETLGPYTALEAASLVAAGQLRPNDYAACNNDPAWVALAEFLPPPSLARALEAPPPLDLPAPGPGIHPHRWRRLAVAFVILLATPLIVAIGVREFGNPRADHRSMVPAAPLRTELPPGVTALSSLVAIPPVLQKVALPEISGPLSGSLSFALPSGEHLPLAGVRVSVFPLTALGPVLDQENTEAQAARLRLDPQIEAAATERSTRAAEAQAALQTLREANPTDPLFASLRFASQGAKTAAKTAEDDYRYLVGERVAAAGGEVYFRGLPEPTLTTDTDAQGNFELPLPPGEEAYVVAASARQTTDGGTVQSRYWLVKLSPAQQAGRERLQLDDGNASLSPAPESLIHTAD